MPIELGDGIEIRVAPPELPTVTTTPPGLASVVVLPVAGADGPPGPAGPGGGGYFEYVQIVPAATWIIDHNLGRKVQVSLFDVTGTVRYADVHHGTINQATIVFPGPDVGSAVIS